MSATGRCACGEIRYWVTGPLRPIVACHCAECRRTSGHHVAATSCLRENLTVEGQPKWWVSSPGRRRGFCGTCGSTLFWDREGTPGISIFAGSLDQPTGLEMIGHIFLAEKGDYYTIADGLPQADLSDPSLTTAFPARR